MHLVCSEYVRNPAGKEHAHQLNALQHPDVGTVRWVTCKNNLTENPTAACII